ncbi:MAG: hypothetical protein M3220_18190 [Chloroflexota bacterium]|nr:hypothetical protein [Chloroflexota bacterium]
MQRYSFFLLLAFVALLIGCTQSPPQTSPVPTTTPVVADSDVADEEGDAEAYPAPSETDTSDSSYPAPVATDAAGVEDDSYPAPAESTPIVTLPAEEVYPIAAEAAQEWREDAYFVGLVPAFQMQQNLNVPPLRGGWFFKFALEDSLDEYYVLVLGESISGSTVAQPILIEPLPYTEEPIDIDQLEISSEEFERRFFESEVGAPYEDDQTAVDFRLVDLDSTPNPVWSALLAESGEELFHLDAMTGEEVAGPFDQYQ